MTDETFELTKFSDSMSNREQPGTKPDTEVGDIAPIYQTLPGEEESHSHYKNKEVRFPGSQSSTSTQEPHPVHASNAFVNQGSIRRHAQNDLYVDTKVAGDEYRHATLQQDGTLAHPQSYRGPVSMSVQEPEVKYSSCSIKPKHVWLYAFVTLTFLVSVASLALVLLLWFGVYSPSSCDCGDTEVQVQDLQRQVSLLRQQLTANVSELREDVSDLLTGSFSADVELYEQCTTKTEAVCTLSPGGFISNLGFTACETSDVSINNTETYLLEAHCEKFDTNAAEPEANPVTAVLQADESGNQVRCQCWVVVPGSLLDHTEVVQCNLVVTRCPRVQTLFFSNATSNP